MSNRTPFWFSGSGPADVNRDPVEKSGCARAGVSLQPGTMKRTPLFLTLLASALFLSVAEAD